MNRDPFSSEGRAPRGASQTSNENSGLIDLRALMAAAKSTAHDEPVDSAEIGHLPVYPLGAPASQPPPAPPVQVAAPAPHAGRGQKVFAAVAVLVLAAVAAGVGVLLLARAPAGTTADVRVDTAGPTIHALPEAAKVDVAPPTDSPVAAPRDPVPAVATAPGATPSPEIKARPGKPGPLPGPAKPPAGQKTATGQKTPPAKSPAADPCKGDLLCAMKRSTERH